MLGTMGRAVGEEQSAGVGRTAEQKHVLLRGATEVPWKEDGSVSSPLRAR